MFTSYIIAAIGGRLPWHTLPQLNKSQLLLTLEPLRAAEVRIISIVNQFAVVALICDFEFGAYI